MQKSPLGTAALIVACFTLAGCVSETGSYRYDRGSFYDSRYDGPRYRRDYRRDRDGDWRGRSYRSRGGDSDRSIVLRGRDERDGTIWIPDRGNR